MAFSGTHLLRKWPWELVGGGGGRALPVVAKGSAGTPYIGLSGESSPKRGSVFSVLKRNQNTPGAKCKD